MTIFSLLRASDLTTKNSVYKLQGFTGTGTANTTTNIDWVFPQERWVSGGLVFVKTPHWGDKITIQIIDIDNTLGYGANTVLREFATDFMVRDDSQFQCHIEIGYVALVYSGLYARIVYTNSHASEDSKVSLNLITHIPTA